MRPKNHIKFDHDQTFAAVAIWPTPLTTLKYSFGGRKIRSQSLKGEQMKSLAIHSALLAALGALAFMGTVATTTVPANAKCMIDEGNGRKTPCEALYKSKKCVVDEGNGRFTPCEALLKPKKTKKG
jgi:hypothetical protein